MQLDIDRLNNRVDNSEELATEAHDVMKRMVSLETFHIILTMTGVTTDNKMLL